LDTVADFHIRAQLFLVIAGNFTVRQNAKRCCFMNQSVQFHHILIGSRNGEIARCLQQLLLELRRCNFMNCWSYDESLHNRESITVLLLPFALSAVSMGRGNRSHCWTPGCNIHCDSRRSLSCKLHFRKAGKSRNHAFIGYHKILLLIFCILRNSLCLQSRLATWVECCFLFLLLPLFLASSNEFIGIKRNSFQAAILPADVGQH